MTTTKTARLGDLGTNHVWFTSVGQPAGCDLIGEPDEGLHLPGDTMPGDASDWWELDGSVLGNRWTWNGEGSPVDYKGNTVQKIVAFV